MFEIDDEFLASIGYDVTRLTEEQKDRYKTELTEEVQDRVIERLAPELDEAQIADLESIQNSAERAESWLYEFHSDFQESEGYQAVIQALGELDGKIFYASTLWLQDAIPDYSDDVRDVLNVYQNELIELRERVHQSLSS